MNVVDPTRLLARAALLCCTALAALPAIAADISLKNAWMRPIRAGYPAAALYVDIRTDIPLKLVGARSPISKSSGVVLVVQNPDGSATETPVKEVNLPGGEETRFALNGNRIELREIVGDAPPGGNIPVVLEFVEAKGGARHEIEIGVLVRGVILPPPYEPGKETPQ